jgi:hypothetical protein
LVKYYSTLDDNVFNSERELIDYIKEKYVKKIEEIDSDLLTKVSKEFPDWDITMEPSSCRAKNRFCLRK